MATWKAGIAGCTKFLTLLPGLAPHRCGDGWAFCFFTKLARHIGGCKIRCCRRPWSVMTKSKVMKLTALKTTFLCARNNRREIPLLPTHCLTWKARFMSLYCMGDFWQLYMCLMRPYCGVLASLFIFRLPKFSACTLLFSTLVRKWGKLCRDTKSRAFYLFHIVLFKVA